MTCGKWRNTRFKDHGSSWRWQKGSRRKEFLSKQEDHWRLVYQWGMKTAPTLANDRVGFETISFGPHRWCKEMLSQWSIMEEISQTKMEKP